MNFDNSKRLFAESVEYMPGGVNSPVRAFGSIGITPPFIVKGEGSKIFDEDGNKYIDYVGSWGPIILGHNNPLIKEALQKQLENGTSFGAPGISELELSRLICNIIPSVEMIRMVNSGTEAVMSALRLARAYTKREKIVKFAGNYHGHADSMLIQAGSGALTHGVPSSPGVNANTAQNTIIANYNNTEEIEQIFENYGEEIAAVILEPVSGNMGVVPASQEFINKLRNLTEKYGALLIFDEVMTGFRVALGGAQSLYNIKPDITCFGKIIGGGLPVGAYGGKREIMENISPLGPVYQAGTLSGNPLTMTAGFAAIKYLSENPEVYNHLENSGQILQAGIEKNIRETGIKATINRVGSMITLFFTDEKVFDYNSAKKSDTNLFADYFKEMLYQGIYLPPSQFEAFFISNAHTLEDIEKNTEANKKTFKKILK